MWQNLKNADHDQSQRKLQKLKIKMHFSFFLHLGVLGLFLLSNSCKQFKKHFMKTNLLFAAALLLSTASFAQQTPAGGTSISASASAEAKTGAVNTAEAKVKKTKKEIKKEAASQKAKAKSAVAKTSAGASVNGNADVNASAGNNKLSQDASLNSSAGTSAVVQSGGKTKAVVKSAVQPKPVAVKMNTPIKANAGIKIK
jgi:hypothetical protein